MHDMNSWDWLWMTSMMVFWTAILGGVVYVAVRIAERPPERKER